MTGSLLHGALLAVLLALPTGGSFATAAGRDLHFRPTLKHLSASSRATEHAYHD